MAYYTYAYLRVDGTPYYIGAGTDRRAFKKSKGEVHPPKDKSRIIFLHTNINKSQSRAFEIFWIAVYGRKDLGTGILRNKTHGGDGGSGPRSEETKRKISESTKGKTPWNRGIPQTDEAKRKNRESQLGISKPGSGNFTSPTEETKQKQKDTRAHNLELNPNYYCKTDEQKIAMSQCRLGKKHTDEHRANMSKALLGLPKKKKRILSAEHKQRVSESIKKMWDKKRGIS